MLVGWDYINILVFFLEKLRHNFRRQFNLIRVYSFSLVTCLSTILYCLTVLVVASATVEKEVRGFQVRQSFYNFFQQKLSSNHEVRICVRNVKKCARVLMGTPNLFSSLGSYWRDVMFYKLVVFSDIVTLFVNKIVKEFPRMRSELRMSLITVITFVSFVVSYFHFFA